MPMLGRITGWPLRFSSAVTSVSVSILSPARKIHRRFRPAPSAPARPATFSATASISTIRVPLTRLAALSSSSICEETPPRRHHRAQEIRDLDQRLEHVEPRVVVIMKVRLARIGGEADQFRALTGSHMAVATRVRFRPESRMAGLVIVLQPHRLKGEAHRLGLEDEHQWP
jgi:hypothetical protein